MDYVRDRIWAGLDESDLARVNTELGEIQVAVVDEEPEAAAEAARRLRRHPRRSRVRGLIGEGADRWTALLSGGGRESNPPESSSPSRRF